MLLHTKLESCLRKLGNCDQSSSQSSLNVKEGENVPVRYTYRGTHLGVFMGMPPTGKQITVTGLEFLRLGGFYIFPRNGVLVSGEYVKKTFYKNPMLCFGEGRQ